MFEGDESFITEGWMGERELMTETKAELLT